MGGLLPAGKNAAQAARVKLEEIQIGEEQTDASYDL